MVLWDNPQLSNGVFFFLSSSSSNMWRLRASLSFCIIISSNHTHCHSTVKVTVMFKLTGETIVSAQKLINVVQLLRQDKCTSKDTEVRYRRQDSESFPSKFSPASVWQEAVRSRYLPEYPKSLFCRRIIFGHSTIQHDQDQPKSQAIQ